MQDPGPKYSPAHTSVFFFDSPGRHQSEKSEMRKYKQLTLFLVASASFIAFLFYKHEYDRLRYTLEYLEVFGEPPKQNGDQPSQCNFALQQRSSTPPAEWTKVSNDISIYSTFWDEDNGLVPPKLRTLALVQKSAQPPTELKVQIFYENGVILDASCEMENSEARKHISGGSNEFHIVFIICTPNTGENRKALQTVSPHYIQFSVGHGRKSDLKPIHESNGLKTVEDQSAVCVLPLDGKESSLNIIEFISFYQALGFSKFTFYGNVLTPITRKLLNKFMDEMNIFVEEKSFNFVPALQTLNANMTKESIPQLKYLTKRIVELDCQYRHRDVYENIVALSVNEFIIINKKDSIQNLLKSLSILGRKVQQISEFHLSSQEVCIDSSHQSSTTRTKLMLGQQIRSVGGMAEIGTAILRPHLLTTSIGQLPLVQEQHVSPASAVVYKFMQCAKEQTHEDIMHLPTRTNYVSLIESSLLYRKWTVEFSGPFGNLF